MVTVIARSESDPFGKLRAGSAIPCKEFYSWDCFVAFAPRNDINPVRVVDMNVFTHALKRWRFKNYVRYNRRNES
ncbi:MAG: hypothetical protein FWC80_06540 [Firmicutes bacterium]|nr:hypothetical protein [Bacillota bacterium]